jgi:hypothetical protein
MAGTKKLTILSDIHYAGAAERARGNAYEFLGIHNPFLRLFARTYRHYIWLRHPLEQNYLLDRFLEQDTSPDYVVANGDYTCDSAFIGVSDDAAFQSVAECLGKLRAKFGDKLLVNFGDHEVGKVSFFGGQGGMRVASWFRASRELGIEPFWQVTLGKYVLMGITSSLVALPVYEPDTLEAERKQWYELRAEHLAKIRNAFAALNPDQRVLLFCHDPTALPFLLADQTIRARTPQIEQTVIGHLHSGLILWKSRRLAGMPRLTFCGHTVRRLSTALRAARDWRPFRVRLCPALAGIELLKDGGYLTAELDLEAKNPARFTRHPLPRAS